jgi:hypothetical protein
MITVKSTKSVLLLHEDTRRNAKYVQFVHACLRSPPPTTFLRAVSLGYLSGPNQFPRLTAKMVRQHMPDSEATAKGHLDKTPTGQPHANSQSVSAQRRLHQHNLYNNIKQLKTTKLTSAFDPTSVPRSTTIHIDYTGRLPNRGSSGTICYLIACWGSYTHVVPVTSLRGPETATAIKAAVEFFRKHDVQLTKIRMDNQLSPEAKQMAIDLDLEWELVLPYQHEPNRAERAIRTAKNHIIAIRAGFHKDCPNTFVDRCLFQAELTLNLLHPFEYDPSLSAHHGLLKQRFDFARHPIAPLGSKVLTWNSPDNRGSWSDHGVAGIYLGPAMTHFRGFHIWVPQTSAMRVSGTVWWFLKPLAPDDDLLASESDRVMYPASKERSHPVPDG